MTSTTPTGSSLQGPRWEAAARPEAARPGAARKAEIELILLTRWEEHTAWLLERTAR